MMPTLPDWMSEPTSHPISTEPWLSPLEGQLSVDVLETEQNIIIRSAIAGVKAEDLDINVTQDTVTIHGKREEGCHASDAETAHVQECYWGNFSRSIVLPCHIRPDEAEAMIKNGILTITLKKARTLSRLTVIEEKDF